jgi:hypothetical protein
MQTNPTCSRPGGAGVVSSAKFVLGDSGSQYLGLELPAGSADEHVSADAPRCSAPALTERRTGVRGPAGGTLRVATR